jgi:hypothetical protein
MASQQYRNRKCRSHPTPHAVNGFEAPSVLSVEEAIYELGISAIVAVFALLMVLMPVRAADVAPGSQPAVIQVLYPEAYYGHHWYGACRDPHFRRRHPFLCW